MQIRRTRGPLAVLLLVPLALLATSAVSAGVRRDESGDSNDRLLAAIHATMKRAHAARELARTGDLRGSEESLAQARRIAESIPEFNAMGAAYFEIPAIIDRVKADISRKSTKHPGKRDRGTRKITG